MRRVMTVLGVAILVAAGVIGAPVAALAATATGALTVMVVTPQKKLIVNDYYIESIPVVLTTAAGATIATATTDATGHATFWNVPAASDLTLHLRPVANETPYIPASRPGVAIPAGAHPYVELVAQYGGQITGTLTGPTWKQIPGRNIVALDRSGRIVASTGAADDGTYQLWGLPSGDYTVMFDRRYGNEFDPDADGFIWQFYRGAPAFTGATFVHVNAQSATAPETLVSGIDAALVKGHTLTGKIFSSFPQDFGQSCGVQYISTSVDDSFCTSTDGAGNLFSEAVPAADYQIEVSRPSTTRPGQTIHYWYAGEGVPPASSQAGAATIHFTGTADVTITMSVH